MDSGAVGESGKPEKSLVERILENPDHPTLESDIGKDAFLGAGDQFFGVAQLLIKDKKVIKPLDEALTGKQLKQIGSEYGIFEFLKRGCMGFIDSSLPDNISLSDWGRYKFEVTGFRDYKIKNIAHQVFYARILSEELTGAKRTHYEKAKRKNKQVEQSVVPAEISNLWRSAKIPGTEKTYPVLRGNDAIRWEGIKAGDSFNAILMGDCAFGNRDWEIWQFLDDFKHIGYVKPYDLHRKFETSFDYNRLHADFVYRFVAVHISNWKKGEFTKFYCIPLHLVKGNDAAHVRYESA